MSSPAETPPPADLLADTPIPSGITPARRSTTTLLVLCLTAVSAAIYLSPTDKQTSAAASGQAPFDAATAQPSTSAVPSATGTPSATPTATPTSPTATAPRTSPGAGYRPVITQGPTGQKTIVYVPVYRDGATPRPTAPKPTTPKSSSPKPKPTTPKPTTPKPTTPKPRPTTPTPTTPKWVWCTDFKWQQDAQTAYVANLSDPYGLDGAPGPYNGDGLACTQLTVDGNRAASRPIAAYEPPAPADTTALAAPQTKYFGVAEDGLPSNTPLFNTIATQAGKAPSSLSWFSYFDQGFDGTKVRSAWAHGALPVITWMTLSGDKNDPNRGTYTLANIVSGKLDRYLLGYAGAILKTGLPVALRWNHEMNGNWYPWSAGMKANLGAPGEPNLYVQAWRHIWDVFASVGANSNVIWLWSPVRVDNIRPHSTVSGYKYETSMAEDYPGDEYVDWTGMSAYQYKPSDGWTYESTFRKTLDELHSVCEKPIFVAETGATQAVGTSDYSAEKAAWIRDTLTGLAVEPGVVGFTWFNNTVNDVHRVDGQLIQTDWRFTSSNLALEAFRTAIDDPAFSSGVMPDTTGAAAK